jgi:alpha-glucosidase
MDFTPMVFGDMGALKRITGNGFELAQSALLLSGIQHFAEIPQGMATVPALPALLQALKDKGYKAVYVRWEE